MILNETQSRRVLAKMQAPRVKYVIWSSNYDYVALISKHSVIRIRSLDVPLHLTHLKGSKLYFLDREAKMRASEVYLTECEFKIAPDRHNLTEGMRMVRHSRLCVLEEQQSLSKRCFRPTTSD
ncbi:unnamed protein product [Albugo candida]|uniref:Coatomer WD associated region domain-containing protein n=1 Tax=Albugo candida TaxID=65357 RepID=A0A024FW86_9STRA|nr:unnamed protein product [Albugo candida]|eukprot:CCI11301.1 unnamed protein product [Albugo candida]